MASISWQDLYNDMEANIIWCVDAIYNKDKITRLHYEAMVKIDGFLDKISITQIMNELPNIEPSIKNFTCCKSCVCNRRKTWKALRLSHHVTHMTEYISNKCDCHADTDFVEKIASCEGLPLQTKLYNQLVKALIRNIWYKLIELSTLVLIPFGVVFELRSFICEEKYFSINHKGDNVKIVEYQHYFSDENVSDISIEYYKYRNDVLFSRSNRSKVDQTDIVFDPNKPTEQIKNCFCFLILNDKRKSYDYIPVIRKLVSELRLGTRKRIYTRISLPSFEKIRYALLIVIHFLVKVLEEAENGTLSIVKTGSLMESLRNLLDQIPLRSLILDQRRELKNMLNDLIFNLQELDEIYEFPARNLFARNLFEFIKTVQQIRVFRRRMEWKRRMPENAIDKWYHKNNQPNGLKSLNTDILVKYRIRNSIAFRVVQSKTFKIQNTTIFKIWTQRLKSSKSLTSDIKSREDRLCPICLEEYPEDTDNLSVLSNCSHILCLNCMKMLIKSSVFNHMLR